MKALILLAICVGVSGCGRTVYENDLDVLIAFCDERGGVTYLGAYSNASVRCNNGEILYFADIRK